VSTNGWTSPPASPWRPDDPHILNLLTSAPVVGSRWLASGSNEVFLLELDGGAAGQGLAVYKPQRGEAPLWDFPSGSLYRREVASFRLSRALGWPAIPPTVAREGPHGMGAVQCYIPSVSGAHYLTFRHERVAEVQAVALFDLLTNNADRKAGHCLLGEDGRVWAIDHGLTFHVEPKLRTVIWDFVGERVPDALVEDLERLSQGLATDPSFVAELGSLLEPAEMAALARRCQALLERPVFPEPPPNRRSVPWPMV